MSEVREWNILLSEIKDIVLWFHSFTTGPEVIQ